MLTLDPNAFILHGNIRWHITILQILNMGSIIIFLLLFGLNVSNKVVCFDFHKITYLKRIGITMIPEEVQGALSQMVKFLIFLPINTTMYLLNLKRIPSLTVCSNFSYL